MKLIFDLLKFTVVGLCLFFLTATFLAGGSYVLEKSKKTVQDHRCDFLTCQENVDQSERTVRTAKDEWDKAKKAKDNAIEEAKKKQKELSGQIEAVEQQIMTQTRLLGEVATNYKIDFSQLNVAPTLDGWTPQEAFEKRNDLFIKTCERATVGSWDAPRCRRILDEARVTPNTATGLAQMSHEQWGLQVSLALGTTCEKGRWIGERGMNRVFPTCDRRVDLVKPALSLIQKFLNAADAYHDIQTRLDGHESHKATLEKQLSKVVGEENAQTAEEEAKFAYDQALDAMDAAKKEYNVVMSNSWNRIRFYRDEYWHFVSPYLLWAFLILLGMYLWRPLAYFTLAPLVAVLRGVRLLDVDTWKRWVARQPSKMLPAWQQPAGPLVAETFTPEPPTQDVTMVATRTPALDASVVIRADQRQQTVHLQPGEKLWVRPEYVVSSKGGSSQWIYGGFKHPFTSYAAGLVGMTVFDGQKKGQQRRIIIAGTGEALANAYIARIELKNHPGFAIRPSHIVAFQGDVKVRFRWVLGHMVSWLRLQLRHAVFYGTGTIYVVGFGGIIPGALPATSAAEDEQPLDQFDDGLLIGWDTRMTVRAARNENWIHVALLRRDAMFESALEGTGVYVLTNSIKQRKPDVAGRVLEAILGTIGKVLGI